MFRPWLTRLRRIVSGRSLCARPIRRRHHCEPTLERLEDRVILKAETFWWEGTAGAIVPANQIPAAVGNVGTVRNWTDVSNWDETTVPADNGNTYPGDPTRAGSSDDTVNFDITGANAASCYLNPRYSNMVVGTVVVNFSIPSQHLLIASGHSLTVVGGNFTMENGTIDLLESGTAAHTGSSLRLNNIKNASWSGGKLSPNTGYGTVYVYRGSTLNITQNGGVTGAHLVIGRDPTDNADSPGTLNIATLTENMNANANLVLEINATITNYSKGTVNFDQNKSLFQKPYAAACLGR